MHLVVAGGRGTHTTCNHTPAVHCAHYTCTPGVEMMSSSPPPPPPRPIPSSSQWSKHEEEGEPAEKKGRREEGEMRFMEPLGEVQVCVCCMC